MTPSIGAIEQSYNLSRMVTKKILGTHKIVMPEAQVANIVESLAGQYFSHSHLISRAEVESDLGLSVTRPDDDLAAKIRSIEDHYGAEFRKVVSLENNATEPFLRIGALLQTADSGWMILQVLGKDGTTIADPWVKFR